MESQVAEADRKQANIRIAQVKKRVADLADIENMNSLIKELKDMRGTGGSEAKRTKFGDEAMSTLSICVRVCDAQLNQGKPDTE